MKFRNLIWYDIGLLIGTALTAAGALARRVHRATSGVPGAAPRPPR